MINLEFSYYLLIFSVIKIMIIPVIIYIVAPEIIFFTSLFC